VLNFSPDTAVDADVELHRCGAVAKEAKHHVTCAVVFLRKGQSGPRSDLGANDTMTTEEILL